MNKKTFTLVFKNESQKARFQKALGEIPELDLAKMCGTHIYRISILTASLYVKIKEEKLSLELTKEELRCLTIYFGRNPTELTSLSPVHRNFLLVARNAGFEVEKPVWEKPKNAVKFTDQEIQICEKVLDDENLSDFLLLSNNYSKEEFKTILSIESKFLKLIEKKKVRDKEFGKYKVKMACSQDFADEAMAKKYNK